MPSTADNEDSILKGMPEIQGYKFLDPCVIYCRLGEGGMGTVYYGRHLQFDVDVAIKCLKPDMAAKDKRLVDRFRREARTMVDITSPNLVRVFAVNQVCGVHYLVMEYVRGENATDRVERKGALDVQEACTIALGAAKGLADIHKRGVVHRDIKPDNILISDKGEVKVADLGLAKPVESGSRMTRMGALMGTPQYMPREQWLDAASVDANGDVYSLGATLYFLLTGRTGITGSSLESIRKRVFAAPFPDVREVLPDIDPDLAAILRKATAPTPEDRYQDAGELRDALLPFSYDAEDDLADEGAQRSSARRVQVSRPPEQVEARIKVEFDRGGVTVSTGDGPTVRFEPIPTTENMPAPVPDRQLGLKLGVAASLLGIGALGTYLYRSKPALASGGSNTATPATSNDLSRAQKHFREGERQLDLGGFDDLASAALSFQQAQQAYPGFSGANERLARARCLQAKLLAEQEEWDKAFGYLQQSVDAKETQEALDLRGALESGLVKRLESCLTSISPDPALATKVDNLVVTFEASDPCLLSLRCNGVQLTPENGIYRWNAPETGDGEVSARLELIGPNQLRHGRVLSWFRDRQDPVIKILEPVQDGKPVRPPVLLRVQAEDRSEVDLELAAQASSAEFTRSGNTWESSLDLDEGQHTVIVKARDQAGNQTTEEMEVTVDATAPTLTLLTQMDPAVPVNQRSLSIDIQVNELGKLEGLSRLPWTIEETGKNTVKLELDEGQNLIWLTAEDPAGNRSDPIELRVAVDLDAPALKIYEPEDGQLVRGKQLTLKGFVGEDGCELLVLEQTLKLDQQTWEQSVDLELGTQTLTLQARDAAGNLSEPVYRRVKVIAPYPETFPGLRFRGLNDQGYAEYDVEKVQRMTLIYIPESRFRMGARNQSGARFNESPEFEVELEGYFLSKHEVTNQQYANYCRKTGADTPREAQQNGNLPITNVGWQDAASFCTWAGLRLPTEAEWEYAARGPARWDYPWGNSQPIKSEQAQGNFLRMHKLPVHVGSYPKHPGPFGSLDQAGNAFEWCADGFESYTSTFKTNPLGRGSQGMLVIRGGSFQSPDGDRLRSTHRMPCAPDTRAPDIGFRVALSAAE